LFGLNQLEDAEENIREVLRLEPDSAEARLLLADILNRRKDYGALLEDLDEFLKLYPDHPSGVKVKALRDKTVRALIESQSSASIAAAQR
jgi:tetratricopeptide (TPR) repeat protein